MRRLEKSAPLALLVLLVLVGCASQAAPPAAPETGQSFPEALKMVCNVDALAGLSDEQDPLTIGQARTAWITEHVENPDGIELRTLVSVKGAEEQAKTIREKAKEVGIEKCPLADSIENAGAGGLSP